MSTTEIYDIRDIERLARGHFFSTGAMRFFKSRILANVYQGSGGVFFVSSERRNEHARRYTVRQFFPETGEVSTAEHYDLDGFQYYSTAHRAQTAAKRLSRGDTP